MKAGHAGASCGALSSRLLANARGCWPKRDEFSKRRTILSVVNNPQTLDPTGAEESDDEPEEEVEQIPLIPAERYSSAEWLKCLLTLPFSFALKRVASHLVANTLFAAFVWLAYVVWPQTTRMLISGLTPTPHMLLGSALGLLLVFRTNTAYDRFWEARKLWGFLISRTRELSRIAHCSMSGRERDRFLQLLAAAPPILLQHLRSGWVGWELTSQADGQDLIQGLVAPEDAQMLLKGVNRPFLLVKMLGAILRRAYSDVATVLAPRLPAGAAAAAAAAGNAAAAAAALTPVEVAILQAGVMVDRQHSEMLLLNLVEAIGGCERIVKTTVPISYSRHTSRFLSVWCLTLPLVLVESLKWRVIPASLVVCWALFVIEEVGHLIEDPFNMVWQGLDELKLERSFPNMRLEIAERLPHAEPRGPGGRTATLARPASL